eukprot:Rmarinus@m.10383
MGVLQKVEDESSKPATKPAWNADVKSSENALSSSGNVDDQPQSNETHFIPLNVAREHITKMVEDMAHMRSEHMKIIDEMDVHYRGIEKDTVAQFQVFIQELRKKYKQQLREQKSALSDLLQETRRVTDDACAKEESFRSSIRVLSEENKTQLERIHALEKEILEAEKQQDEERRWMQDAFSETLQKKDQDLVAAIEENTKQLEQLNEENALLLKEKEMEFAQRTAATSKAHRNQIQELRNELEDVRTKITGTTQDEVLEITERAEKAEAELKTAKEKISQLEKEKEELAGAMAGRDSDAQDERARAERQLVELRDNFDKEKKELQDRALGGKQGLLQEIEEKDQRIARLTRALKDKDELTRSLLADLNNAQPVKEIAENPEVVRLEKELEAARAELSDPSRQKDAVAEEIEAWKRDFEEKHGNTPSTEDMSEIKDLTERYERVQAEVKDLQEKNESMRKQLAAAQEVALSDALKHVARRKKRESALIRGSARGLHSGRSVRSLSSVKESNQEGPEANDANDSSLPKETNESNAAADATPTHPVGEGTRGSDGPVGGPVDSAADGAGDSATATASAAGSGADMDNSGGGGEGNGGGDSKDAVAGGTGASVVLLRLNDLLDDKKALEKEVERLKLHLSEERVQQERALEELKSTLRAEEKKRLEEAERAHKEMSAAKHETEERVELLRKELERVQAAVAAGTFEMPPVAPTSSGANEGSGDNEGTHVVSGADKGDNGEKGDSEAGKGTSKNSALGESGEEKQKTKEDKQAPGSVESVTAQAIANAAASLTEGASEDERSRAVIAALEAELEKGRKGAEEAQARAHAAEVYEKLLEDERGKVRLAEEEVAALKNELNRMRGLVESGKAAAGVKEITGRYQEEIARLKKKVNTMVAQMKKMKDTHEAEIKQATAAAAAGGGGGGGGGGGVGGEGGGKAASSEGTPAAGKKGGPGAATGGGGGQMSLKDKKAFEKAQKDLKTMTERYNKTKEKADKGDEEIKSLKKEVETLKKQTAGTSKEIKELKEQAEQAQALQVELDAAKQEIKKGRKEYVALEESYKEQVVLRKKLHNTIEDMKGKIRVYCRTRPMAQYEIENQSKSIVDFPDEFTIALSTSKGVKSFQYDQVFPAGTSQSQVYEETCNLVQSAVDGYNVCIFAYGQTGSGKTFTMMGGGTPDLAGITPRALKEIFQLRDKMKDFEFKIECYMLELYNDQLVDLLVPKGASERAKLDIKKDSKGMVFVAGAEIKSCPDLQDLENWLRFGEKSRHVGGTKMNAQSSRSHLVFSVLIHTKNLNTGAGASGKLSLVDLAGSERASKTGATAERLREAQSINKSLSALGDVISALSNGEKFIPYRNNKLTNLMSDSLGGNAKTQMFVNISPADYNCDETLTSLVYASRVKLITNDASKNAESKEIKRLKHIIDNLRNGRDENDGLEENS